MIGTRHPVVYAVIVQRHQLIRGTAVRKKCLDLGRMRLCDVIIILSCRWATPQMFFFFALRTQLLHRVGGRPNPMKNDPPCSLFSSLLYTLLIILVRVLPLFSSTLVSEIRPVLTVSESSSVSGQRVRTVLLSTSYSTSIYLHVLRATPRLSVGAVFFFFLSNTTHNSKPVYNAATAFYKTSTEAFCCETWRFFPFTACNTFRTTVFSWYTQCSNLYRSHHHTSYTTTPLPRCEAISHKYVNICAYIMNSYAVLVYF